MQSTEKGVLIALAGVVVLSLDSLLVELVDASPWNLLFWRGSLLSGTLLLVKFLSTPGSATERLPGISPMIFLGATAFAMSMVFFVLALNHTQVASAVVIINTAPFFAAIIALVVLRERVELHTIVAIAVATAGIWLIFEYAPDASEISGDVYALLAAIGTASYLVVMRSAKGEDGASYLIVAGIMTAVTALIMGANPGAIHGSSLLFMFILGCLVVPGSGLLIARAPKYLPAAQTGLILLLEILLGPLFVFLALGIKPSENDIAGGMLVLLTLTAHTLWEVHRFRPTDDRV
jgi:drug/metabolite transporter (DMT)-like permease